MSQIVVPKALLFRIGFMNHNNLNMEDVDFYLRINEYVHYVRVPIPTVLYYDTNGISFDAIKTIKSLTI